MGSLHEEYAVIPLVTELLRDWVRGHKVVQPLCWPMTPFHHRDMIYIMDQDLTLSHLSSLLLLQEASSG